MIDHETALRRFNARDIDLARTLDARHGVLLSVREDAHYLVGSWPSNNQTVVDLERLTPIRCWCSGTYCAHSAAVIIRHERQSRQRRAPQHAPELEESAFKASATAPQSLSFRDLSSRMSKQVEDVAENVTPLYELVMDLSTFSLHVRLWQRNARGAESPMSSASKARTKLILTTEDRSIMSELMAASPNVDHLRGDTVSLARADTGWLIPAMTKTGRLFSLKNDLEFAHDPEPVDLEINWAYTSHDRTYAVLNPVDHDEDGEGVGFMADRPWYVDGEVIRPGVLPEGYAPDHVRQVLALDPVEPSDLREFGRIVSKLMPSIPLPDGAVALPVEFRPILQLHTHHQSTSPNGLLDFKGHRSNDAWERWGAHNQSISMARVLFNYAVPNMEGGYLVHAPRPQRPMTKTGKLAIQHDSWDPVENDEGDEIHIADDFEAREDRVREIASLGMRPVPKSKLSSYNDELESHSWGLESEADWTEFFTTHVPELKAKGWDVQVMPGFTHCRYEAQSWKIDLAQDGEGAMAPWLMSLGVEINGRMVDLVPLLVNLLEDARWVNRQFVNNVPDDQIIDLRVDEYTILAAPAYRIKPLVTNFVDVLENWNRSGRGNSVIRMHRMDVGRLHAIDRGALWDFDGRGVVDSMIKRMQAAQDATVDHPKGHTVDYTLFPYQLEGLAWMQFLRELGIGGILADDMGLGKTAQTLSHILLEKEAGRLTKPALIVTTSSAPTAWRKDAKKFGGDLKVLFLEGPKRSEHFANIKNYDVVVTTYGVLLLDMHIHKGQSYSLLAVDEAQKMNNVTTKTNSNLHLIPSDLRMPITGTPIGNNLMELWALFDFALPGFLGDRTSFDKNWRKVIEGDDVQKAAMYAELLRSRIKPLILRRTKEMVEHQLPPHMRFGKKHYKRRVVRMHKGKQRDKYEAIRAFASKEVHEKMREMGLIKGSMCILPALMELRQLCCDPDLLRHKMPIDDDIEHAKLDDFEQLATQLLAGGHRVAVFSQFSQMIPLIEKRLSTLTKPDGTPCKFLVITGDVAGHKRGDIIDLFQEGDHDFMLMTTKSGGSAITITAADQVILYDSWFNPTEDDQAENRAHRIGNPKDVTVHRIIVEGSYEEKIVEIQDKKRRIAQSVLHVDGLGERKISVEDLQSLLLPMPAIPEEPAIA